MRTALCRRLYRWSRLWLLLMLLARGWPVAASPAHGERVATVALLPGWYYTAPPPGDEKLAPDMRRALLESPDAPLPVIVRLRGTRHLAPLPTADREARAAARVALVRTLREEFARAVASLDAVLAEAQARGELSARRDLWIIRSLALTASPALIRRLAASPAVASIRLDRLRDYLEDLPLEEASAEDEGTPWGVARIRAPEVWQTLRISGTGAVVAVLDTGTDFLHPAIGENYRGYLGHGLYNHSASWFDAVQGGLYPYDDHGHGTHVLGTAVGQGTGVAPGATWIAAKVLNGAGQGYDSWIHAAFQWVLAPGGDPALAPDVVNASWGSRDRTSTEFAEDIAALIAAGIFPVFAVGNEGPSAATSLSPANLPGVFAVGASDFDEEVPYFSSRGPSPWGEVKPYVVAPGVRVRSSVPGGVYLEADGTSMATPHVAGLAALLRAISPTVAVTTMARLITSTAVPVTLPVPNNTSGWGRIDAFEAAVALFRPAIVSGTVSEVGGGPIPWADVTAVRHGAGEVVARVAVDAEGRYRLALPPGDYDITASAFGYAARTVWGFTAITDAQRRLDFALGALLWGELGGRVTVAGTGLVPTVPVTVRLPGTPLETSVDADGRYHFDLPGGTYALEVRALGYRVARATVTLPPGGRLTRDFALTPIPKILLVDEGAWYYRSQLSYWREALDAMDDTYDVVAIKSPFAGMPPGVTLSAYDVVLWSSPLGSPGLGGGGPLLWDYLRQGGKLFLSGQNVAYYDGGGTIAYPVQAYLYKLIGALYDQDEESSITLKGFGPMAGLAITITGAGGADNQIDPDVVQILATDRTFPLWRYEEGGVGGVAASVCVTYRAAYFAFGYEAINDAATRREVMARTLDWLTAPPPTYGFTLEADERPLVGLPGGVVTHTLTLRDIGAGGDGTPVTVTAEAGRWPLTLSQATYALSPCTSASVVLTVTIPPDILRHVSDVTTVTVRTDRETFTVHLRTKTPAPVLLVDDDRWYDMEDWYTTALRLDGIPYDRWDLLGGVGGIVGATSLPTDVIRHYPLLVWFTGYDWYAPVTSAEWAGLRRYLDDGGRVLLTSQEFLYYHRDDVDALRRYFGVLSWNEVPELAPQRARGVPDHPAGGTWGPVALTYPFRNFADVIEPAPEAALVARGGLGQPIGVAKAGIGAGGRAILYGFPLETLPDATRAEVLERGVFWLSPLGESRLSFSTPVPRPGERVTVEVVLRSDVTESLAVTLAHTLPPSLTLVEATLPSALRYLAATRTIAWEGELRPGQPLTFSWAVTVSEMAAAGAWIDATVRLGLPQWKLPLALRVSLFVEGADLSAGGWVTEAGTLRRAGPSAVRAGVPQTLVFALRNVGYGARVEGRGIYWLSPGLAPLTVTVQPTRGWPLKWDFVLTAGEPTIITLPLRAWTIRQPLRLDVVLESNGRRWDLRTWLGVVPWRIYLPLVLRR